MISERLFAFFAGAMTALFALFTAINIHHGNAWYAVLSSWVALASLLAFFRNSPIDPRYTPVDEAFEEAKEIRPYLTWTRFLDEILDRSKDE